MEEISMKKILTLAVIALVLGSLAVISHVDASTSIGGTISSNATWNLAGSPYKLTGPLAVPSGVTLKIEPGVTVEFGSYYMQVNGTLQARGTSDNKIVFTANQRWITNAQKIMFMNSSTGYDEQSGAGCIIENAVFNVTTLVIHGCSPKISANVFNQPGDIAINAENSYANIIGNIINCQSAAAISASGSAKVTNNFVNSSAYVIGLSAAGAAYFQGNTVNHCWIGITAAGQATIVGNTITNCANNGLQASGNSVRMEGNYISNCQYGISASGTIQSNTVVNNKVGIQIIAPSAPVTNNNIYGNTENNLVLLNSQNLDATNNYWGTTDSQAIAQTIRDAKNDFNAGTVTYTPFLSSPSTSAPANPGGYLSPTATPVVDPTETPISTTIDSPTATPSQSDQSNPTEASTTSISGSSEQQPIQLGSPIVIVTAVVVVAVIWVGIMLYALDRRYKKTEKINPEAKTNEPS